MKIINLRIGQGVVYIPQHLLLGDSDLMIREENLGVITSIGENYAFVKYLNSNNSQATKPEDLYPLDNRPDLMEKIGLEVKPINEMYKFYLKQKETFKNKSLKF